MKKTKIYLLSILIISTKAFGQNYVVKKNQLLDYLYNSKPNIDYVNSNFPVHVFKPIISATQLNKKFDRQILIKTKDKLYLIPEGTGMVLEATDLNNNYITFTRIDSSNYDGYNYRAINFAYHDTLYSFGGYGFWKNNGQLRYFTNNEWLLQPLNKELYGTDCINYFDIKKGICFYLSPEFANQSVKDSKADLTNINVVNLNIKNKEIYILGKVKLEFSNIILDGNILWNSDSLNGVIIRYNQKIYLLNFGENKIYTAKSNKIFDQLLANTEFSPNHIFQNNDTVYYVRNNNEDSLYHFTINRSDFEVKGNTFFTPVEDSNNKNILIYLSLLLVLIGVIVILYNKNTRFKENAVLSEQNLQSSNENNVSTDINKLNDFEIHIIDNMIKEKIITVENLNHILGLSKKSLEIQKKSRNDVIHRINHKFKIIFNSETDLIERIRSEDDKRYFKYKINEVNQKIYMEYKKKQA